MKASSLSFPAATLLAIAGMIWGIVMAASGDHSAMPAHAHLNLLGWVSLFLFGIFYHLHPGLDRSRAAIVQVSIWIVATVIVTIGVALIFTEQELSLGPVMATVGSLIMYLGALDFCGHFGTGSTANQCGCRNVKRQGYESTMVWGGRCLPYDGQCKPVARPTNPRTGPASGRSFCGPAARMIRKQGNTR